MLHFLWCSELPASTFNIPLLINLHTLFPAFLKFGVPNVPENVTVVDESGTEVDDDVFEDVVKDPSVGVLTIKHGAGLYLLYYLLEDFPVLIIIMKTFPTLYATRLGICLFTSLSWAVKSVPVFIHWLDWLAGYSHYWRKLFKQMNEAW